MAGMTLLARDPESDGALIAYAEDEALDGTAQIVCGPGEAAVVLVEGAPVLELPPGRHALTPERHEALAAWLTGGDEAVEVAFLTTSALPFEASGELTHGAEGAAFTASGALRVTGATAAISLLDKLADDESLEAWLEDEVAIHVTAALEALADKPFVELVSGAWDVEVLASATARANEVLNPCGVAVVSLDALSWTLDEET